MKQILIALLAANAFAQSPLVDAIVGQYKPMKLNFIEGAAAIPEADYSFRLTPPQRPLGEWISHTAQGNFTRCAAMLGKETPPEAKLAGETRAKGDVQKVLQASFEYCDAAFKSLTDHAALTEVTVGGKKSYPVTAMISLIASLNEHYGNMVGYLRTKGITPPSTARTQKK
jgi:hypothetical protein